MSALGTAPHCAWRQDFVKVASAAGNVRMFQTGKKDSVLPLTCTCQTAHLTLLTQKDSYSYLNI